MSKNDLENITLADIEAMIKILERFLKLARRAERVMGLFRSYRGRYGGSAFDQFMALAIQQAMARTGATTEIAPEEEEEFELSEREMEVLRKIREGKAKRIT